MLGVAGHSATREPLVVYRPLYIATGWWVRPNAMAANASQNPTAGNDWQVEPQLARHTDAVFEEWK